jgi:hypothetical protein
MLGGGKRFVNDLLKCYTKIARRNLNHWRIGRAPMIAAQ